MKDIKLCICASYNLLSFSVLSQKILFYKRNKTHSPCLHTMYCSLVKTVAKFVRILKQVKTLSTACQVSTDLLNNSPKRFCLGFHQVLKTKRKFKILIRAYHCIIKVKTRSHNNSIFLMLKFKVLINISAVIQQPSSDFVKKNLKMAIR